MNPNQIVMDSTDAYHSDIEKLKRSNARLRSALEMMQWIETVHNCRPVWVCPVCEAFKKGGHFSSCPIKLALEDVEE